MCTAPHAAATRCAAAAPLLPRQRPSTAAATAFGRGSARLLAIALAIVSWGAYGPVLHKGQAAMHHSRLRPLMCVGLAYFVIAVIVPYFFLGEMGESQHLSQLRHALELAGRNVRRGRRAGDHHGVQLRRPAGVCDAAGVRRGAGDQHAVRDRGARTSSAQRAPFFWPG